MEHTINLASKAFIEAICPTPSRYKKAKPGTAHQGISSEREDWDEGSNDDDDEELSWLAGLAGVALVDTRTEVDKDIVFDPGDLLGKLLALINQVFPPILSCFMAYSWPRSVPLHRQKSFLLLCAKRKD